ncbi:helix-turn-helix transcriptional regulator [Gimesia aquarii]|uniref:Anaerobic benzoate catabolism transcriptional regulator n=1 Tax=Gimesia aquarii TaxID=2527964 RepID=A0A517VSE6_9PLAN|nr:helix-turn-helix transcriptional regulator [Gimesia aquarii]QDT95931.1 anaerobic benzoate catabolism transcriptional regulator [Gimesia aquarii]
MPSKEQGTLTNQIRRFRFEHDEMTQQMLASQVGVTRQTIIALESGKYAPSLLLALRIARAFDVRVEDIFQLVEEP